MPSRKAAARAFLSAEAFRHTMDGTCDERVLVIITKSAQIRAEGTSLCPSFPPSLPAPGRVVLKRAQHPGHRQTTHASVSTDEVSELVGTNWRRAEGRAEAGIYVLRGPLSNMNILAIVHFMAQSSAASFSYPDGLN